LSTIVDIDLLMLSIVDNENPYRYQHYKLSLPCYQIMKWRNGMAMNTAARVWACSRDWSIWAQNLFHDLS